jgi:hypothetical protein
MGVEEDVQLRLSLQRALLSHVTPDLRSVSADVLPEKRMVRLRFVFARQPGDSDHNATSIAAAEVIADYPDDWQLEEEYLILPAKVRMSHLRLLVYHRCEDAWVEPDA